MQIYQVDSGTLNLQVITRLVELNVTYIALTWNAQIKKKTQDFKLSTGTGS